MVVNAAEESSEALRRACVNVQTKLGKLLSSPVTVALLAAENGTEKLPVLYGRVSEMLRYRLYYGSGAFIGRDEMAVIHPLDYDIFRKKLQKLREALEKLQGSECQRIFDEIMELFQFCNYEEYSASVLNIAMELNVVLENFALNKAYCFPYPNHDHFTSVVRKADNLEEVHDFFYQFFNSLGNIQIRDNTKNYQRAMQTKAYLDENFSDPNLFAVSIANHFGVAASYLGKTFFEYTRKTLNGYLAEVRIRKSKELLKDLNLSIGGIAESVGFSSVKYFYKVFKDLTGTTPNTWRQQHSEEKVS
jgi:two-component system response regulator YesN